MKLSNSKCDFTDCGESKWQNGGLASHWQEKRAISKSSTEMQTSHTSWKTVLCDSFQFLFEVPLWSMPFFISESKSYASLLSLCSPGVMGTFLLLAFSQKLMQTTGPSHTFGVSLLSLRI